MTAEVTLQEAAELLGVHYMTAYRYVRLGLLDAEKSGGTWRVSRVTLDAFRAGSARAAPGAAGATSRPKAPWGERLEARLVAGDSRGSWGVVEAALSAGAELDEVYLDIISPAMIAIGRRWEAGELDVGVEHRGTVIAFRIIGRLGPRFARRGRSRGTVVLGTPAGEHHALPVGLLADLVRGAGWEVSDLGADLPAASFARAAAEMADDLVAVGVSITTPQCLDAGAETVAVLRGRIEDVPIMVGGRAVRDEPHARSLGADAWAPDGRAVIAVLEELAGGRGRTGSPTP